MKKYKHIFFDLDRTLWDFDKNSEATLFELFTDFILPSSCTVEFSDFLRQYRQINNLLWEDYRQGTISKEMLNVQRFSKTLLAFNCQNQNSAQQMADYYVEESPKKTLLFPYTIELLDYLFTKYTLHIITNGFEEIQFRKLKNSNLEKYFTCVITSEAAGAKKPDARIFEFALASANAKVEDSLMVGDDLEVDILGAQAMGMDALFVNYFNEDFNHQSADSVNSLAEIIAFLDNTAN